MENNIRKYSSANHKENEAILFCQECKAYLCKKCEMYHSEMLQNHRQINLKSIKGENELFAGLCSEINHFIELKFFCKTPKQTLLFTMHKRNKSRRIWTTYLF